VPGFLADYHLSDKNRTATIRLISALEEEERLRRANDAAGEGQRRFIAAKVTALLKSAKAPSLLKTSAGLWQRDAWDFEFMGAALGSPERYSSWLDYSALEEAERFRRLNDQKGEGLKRSLAAKTSALFLLGFQSIQLRPAPHFIAYASLQEEKPTAFDIGLEAIVDSAKSIGNLALRAAQFFGTKAAEGAQSLAAQAADKGPILAEKAQALGGAALEKAAAGAQIAAEKAVAGAQSLGELAKEGAQIAAEKAVIGAQNLGELAKEGAQMAAEQAVIGAQNLGELAKEGDPIFLAVICGHAAA